MSFHLFSTLLRSLLSSLPYSIIPTPNSQISTIPRTTNLKIPLTRQPVPPAISHPRPNLNRKALPQLRNKIYFRKRRQTSAPPMKGNDSSESGILCFQFVWFPPTETAGTRYTFVKKMVPLLIILAHHCQKKKILKQPRATDCIFHWDTQPCHRPEATRGPGPISTPDRNFKPPRDDEPVPG